jgi:hypothetical protein
MDEPDQKIIDVFICKLRKKLMQASSLLPPRAVLMGREAGDCKRWQSSIRWDARVVPTPWPADQPKIVLVEHRRAKLAANLDDHVGWHIVAARRGADGIRVRRLVEAVRLSPVGADEREDPLHALLRVDAIDAFDPLLGEADLSAKFRSIM